MGNGNNNTRITDGTVDFSKGVDSGRNTTVRSGTNPLGLNRNELAWLTNGTVRGGGISPRPGMKALVQGAKWSGLYQGGTMYEQVNGNPYLMLDIGGRTYQVRVDTDNSIHDVTAAAAMPADQTYHWFCRGGDTDQAEQFRITQDGVSEPRVWDGTSFKKISQVGLPLAKLPTGTAMAYANGRIAVASGGRQYVFGDIVGSGVSAPSSGSAAFGFTDGVLNMTESTFASLTGALILPTNAGNIRGFAIISNINQPVSAGQLFVGTRKAVYAFNGGSNRANWPTNEALQTTAQYGNGFVSDRSLVGYNGDLYYQSIEPGVRSLVLAVREFQQYGNLPISRNENRVMLLNDRSLLRFASGIQFNNRLLQTVLPFQTPVGVAHKGLMPLDFDLLGSLEDITTNKQVPSWEGMQEGLDFLQLFQGDFGGLQRAFAAVHSRVSGQIEVWELTLAELRDNGDNRISWYFETPSFDFRSPFALKELESAELWYDRLFGKVEFDVWFRPDQHSCWYFWHHFEDCSARSCVEDPLNELPCVYPTQSYCPQERPSQTLPKPPGFCNTATGRPISMGYQFQVKIQVKGSCRFRGLLLQGLQRDKAPFEGLTC